MNWKQKMDKVVKTVLGIQYEIKVINDNEYEIWVGEKLYSNTQAMKSIQSHWKEFIKKDIMRMYERSVDKIIKEV